MSWEVSKQESYTVIIEVLNSHTNFWSPAQSYFDPDLSYFSSLLHHFYSYNPRTSYATPTLGHFATNCPIKIYQHHSAITTVEVRDREEIFRNEKLKEDILWSQYPMLDYLTEAGKYMAHCVEGVLSCAGFWPSDGEASGRASAALYYHTTVGIMDIIDDTLPSPAAELQSRTDVEAGTTDTYMTDMHDG
ncbi:hypothetical protein K491DRAFT_760381 [Lophiostoma macrostomum CBS 122681]|uniref:Uncharacterized protein n=1 Tax=Lophiostoma macrostomum CBS 122681 TaxID=1314788 RepID=A0A6A6SXJ1_9PLEO|nr:hypothetical protein K491DRAFT_760381 [Lophiostoma macrostomum CBS 122681]